MVQVALPAASPVGEGARRTLIVVSFPDLHARSGENGTFRSLLGF